MMFDIFYPDLSPLDWKQLEEQIATAPLTESAGSLLMHPAWAILARDYA